MIFLKIGGVMHKQVFVFMFLWLLYTIYTNVNSHFGGQIKINQVKLNPRNAKYIA